MFLHPHPQRKTCMCEAGYRVFGSSTMGCWGEWGGREGEQAGDRESADQYNHFRIMAAAAEEEWGWTTG